MLLLGRSRRTYGKHGPVRQPGFVSAKVSYHFDSKHTGLIDSRSSVRSTKDQGYAGLMKEAVGSGRLVHMHSPSFYDDDQSSDRLS